MRAICNARDAARLTLFCAFAGVLLTLATGSRALAQVAGTVSTATGSVQVQRATGTGAISSGMPVNVGDRIITGPGGHAVVTLSDGSQLELGESSTLAIDSQSLAPAGGRAATSLSLFGGVLRSVASATGGPANFEVHTPNAVAAVRGTRWDTAYTEGQARPTYGDCHRFSDVVVYEGVVDVRNATGAAGTAIDVPAGYEVTVPCNANATLPGPIGMTGARSLGSSASVNTTVNIVGGGVPPPACPVCPPVQTSPPPLPPPPPPGVPN